MKQFFKLPVKFRYILYVFLLLNTVLMVQDYLNDKMLNPQKSYAFYFSIVFVTSTFFIWLILTPLLYTISQRILSAKTDAKVILKQVFIGIGIAIFHMVLVMYFRSFMFLLRDLEWMNPFNDHSLRVIVFMVFSSFIQYFALQAAFVALDYYKRYQQKINELNKAQLSALKMQLNPHFLFNTLHTISSLMGKNDRGQKVLSRLGELLRSMLEGNQKMTITLDEELNYLKNYLYIEEVRFQDRLVVIYDIEPSSVNALVPNLILQPIVENAIKHGFSQKTDSGKIQLVSSIMNDELLLQVIDDGIGYQTGQTNGGSGIGLQNVKERLNKMYPSSSSFDIQSINGKGCKVEIKIPLQFQKKEQVA